MIPIRDAVRSRTFPVANALIIAINILAFLWELVQGPHLTEALFLYGVVPLRYTDPNLSAQFTPFQNLLPFLTSMFLHGGFLHILGNMWFLYIFGDNTEDRLGHFRYFFFYLLCGTAAGLIHILTNWHSHTPAIGASGAIAGVMGGYLLLYPRARILTLIPIFLFFPLVELPAYLLLGYWFILQLFSASLTWTEVTGVAWWAHVGGFISGLALIKVFDAIPRLATGKNLRAYTQRRTTPRLQTLSPSYLPDEPGVYGAITVTPKEALYGTRKLISVPRGLRKRTFLVRIPPGVREGTLLRLKGLGREDIDGNREDLILALKVRE
jgi:membrane associated rhomboid family serine protease